MRGRAEGHSDANLTANIYSRISAESTRRELDKLPWIDAHPNAHEAAAKVHVMSFQDKMDLQPPIPKAVGAEELSRDPAPPSRRGKMPHWWTLLDSNQRPFPCQGNALTN
jgi:hypothetical protein